MFMTPANVLAVVTGISFTQTYSCSGSVTTFAFTFPVYESSDLTVQVVTSGVTNVIAPSAYTVSLPSYQSGGSITFPSGSYCPNGSTLSITRNTPLTQETVYRNNQYFNQNILMKDLDKAWMALQEVEYAALYTACDGGCQAAIYAAIIASINQTSAANETIVGVDATIPDTPGSGTRTFTLPNSGVISVCKSDTTANTVTLAPVSGQYVYAGPLSVDGECARLMLLGAYWYKL